MMKIEVLYSSLEHACFYHKMLDMCSCKDTYHRALVYSLGIAERLGIISEKSMILKRIL